jgi:hypothetical protein
MNNRKPKRPILRKLPTRSDDEQDSGFAESFSKKHKLAFWKKIEAEIVSRGWRAEFPDDLPPKWFMRNGVALNSFEAWGIDRESAALYEAFLARSRVEDFVQHAKGRDLTALRLAYAAGLADAESVACLTIVAGKNMNSRKRFRDLAFSIAHKKWKITGKKGRPLFKEIYPLIVWPVEKPKMPGYRTLENAFAKWRSASHET